jgi:hypothetical protein
MASERVGQSLQLANGETVTLMSGQDTQFVTGGQMRVHTGQAIGVLNGAVKAGENGIGLQLIAAKDAIDIQAQSEELKVQARDEIDVISANAHIDWAAAKRISLSTAGGANITIEGDADPYEEIYLQRNKWWGLIREEWLSPQDGIPISWDKFVVNVKLAKEFHRNLAKKYHHNTYVFYGGGTQKGSFSKIRWNIKRGISPAKGGAAPPAADLLSLSHKDMRTDGSNNLYVGGETVVTTTARGDASVARITETSFWEVRCAQHDSAGDGTVPARSGCEPRQSAPRYTQLDSKPISRRVFRV